jgi:hypothetical protein
MALPLEAINMDLITISASTELVSGSILFFDYLYFKPTKVRKIKNRDSQYTSLTYINTRYISSLTKEPYMFEVLDVCDH